MRDLIVPYVHVCFSFLVNNDLIVQLHAILLFCYE